MIKSEAYINGKDAGYDLYSSDDNPYQEGTYNYDEWEEGRLSSIGEKRDKRNDFIEALMSMDRYKHDREFCNSMAELAGY
jgi:hypothetical protein